MKSRAFLAAWAWRFFPRRAVCSQGAKPKSKKSAASCWPTFGKKFMSRIGNKAVEIPDKVKVNIDNDGGLAVEGPKGKLNWKLPRAISAKIDNNRVTLARSAESRSVKALHGLSRSLVHNMIQGVSE